MALKELSTYFLLIFTFQFGVSQTVITDNGELKNPAEVYPYLIQCEDQVERNKCSGQELSKFISKNLRYPALSRENGKEGTLLISFVVNREGYFEQGKVLHAFDKYIREDSEALFEKMESNLKWTPAKVGDKNVSVLYTLPSHFHVLKKPIRKLSSFDEIICERGSSYKSFNVKAKKMQKIFSVADTIEDYWFYDLQQIEFISMDIQLMTKGETIKIEGVKNISEDTLNKLLGAKKGTTIKFVIKEKKDDKVRTVEKNLFVDR